MPNAPVRPLPVRPPDVVHAPRRLVRRLVVTGALVLAIVAAPRAQSVVITPPAPITPTMTLTTINNGPGNQIDPRVDGNLVTYMSIDTTLRTSQVRDFNFSSNTDLGIPVGSGASDTRCAQALAEAGWSRSRQC